MKIVFSDGVHIGVLPNRQCFFFTDNESVKEVVLFYLRYLKNNTIV